MSDPREQVRKFYDVVWNAHNKDAVPELLDSRVRFRGSLGESKVGLGGFIEYLDMVHKALGNYHCEVQEVVSEPPRVFAKMKFSGIHQGDFMGYAPSGKQLTWAGVALFTFEQGKIIDLWVLGDLKSLEVQLKSE